MLILRLLLNLQAYDTRTDAEQRRPRDAIPRTAKGNHYLLVFIDTFTKWVELVPVRTINGKILSQEIKETIFLRFGVCDEYISDNGSEFECKEVNKLLDEYESTHTLIPPRHARANRVERTNRVIKTQIIAFIEEKHNKWDKYIHELMFAYNTMVHESTGMTSAFMNYGRNPTPPKSLKRREEMLVEDLQAEAREE